MLRRAHEQPSRKPVLLNLYVSWVRNGDYMSLHVSSCQVLAADRLPVHLYPVKAVYVAGQGKLCASVYVQLPDPCYNIMRVRPAGNGGLSMSSVCILSHMGVQVSPGAAQGRALRPGTC